MQTPDPRNPNINLDAPWTPEEIDWTGSVTLDAETDKPHVLVLTPDGGDPERVMRAPVEYADGVSLTQLQDAVASGTAAYNVTNASEEGVLAYLEVRSGGVLLAKGKLLAGGDPSEFVTDAEGWTSSRDYEIPCGTNERGKLSYKMLRDSANNETGTLYRWQHTLPDGTVITSPPYTVPKQG